VAQLSSPSSEQRRAALQRLQLIARMGVAQVWEHYFGQILLRVLEALQDTQARLIPRLPLDPLCG
jgi:hypothetical protein